MTKAYLVALQGMLLGLLVIVNIFTIQIIPPYFVFSFVLTVSFLIGELFGPIRSFYLCLLGDLIGCVIHPFGPYNALVGLSCGIIGLIFGFTHKRKMKIWQLICIFIMVTLICTSGLNTLGLWLMYSANKKTFWAYLIARLPYQLLNSIINCALSIIIYKLKGGGNERKVLR